MVCRIFRSAEYSLVELTSICDCSSSSVVLKKFIVATLQSDREKMEGLPVAPFMDRDKVTKPTAQIGFIKFVLIPMFETVSRVCTYLLLFTVVVVVVYKFGSYFT